MEKVKLNANLVVKLIINEQHSLLPDQEKVLENTLKDLYTEKAPEWVDVVKIPATGLTTEEQMELGREVLSQGPIAVIFVSPIPALIGYFVGAANAADPGQYGQVDVLVFGNDKREKKELPNGKVIYTVAKTGWKLIELVKNNWVFK